MVVDHLSPILNEERVDMKIEMQDKQAQVQVEQDQEIADVLGITVLSPLEETAVSGGAVHVDQGSQHVHISLTAR